MNNLKTAAVMVVVALATIGLSGIGIAQADGHKKAAKASIYETAKKAGFKTLTAAIDAAGLDKALSEGGPFTVFAPTDDAFAKLPEGTVEALLKDTETLKQILLYHVVDGSVMAADVVKLDAAKTLNGENVEINTKDGVKVNDANVVKTDIAVANGVIHVIDTVLLPPEDKKAAKGSSCGH